MANIEQLFVRYWDHQTNISCLGSPLDHLLCTGKWITELSSKISPIIFADYIASITSLSTPSLWQALEHSCQCWFVTWMWLNGSRSPLVLFWNVRSLVRWFFVAFFGNLKLPPLIVGEERLNTAKIEDKDPEKRKKTRGSWSWRSTRNARRKSVKSSTAICYFSGRHTTLELWSVDGRESTVTFLWVVVPNNNNNKK